MILEKTCASAPFFSSPPKGRQIIAGFSYLQRMRKGATTRAWFPDPFLDQSVEWAAVREFELLQEGDNLMIDDLNITDMARTTRALRSMQGGGYRIAMITLGCYTQDKRYDDLEILDKKLQEEITRLIHFLYLGEQSKIESALQATALIKDAWSCADALPYVAQSLAEKKLFRPQKQIPEEQVFFEILETLPAKHIVHDVAIGLALPDATKDDNWVYIAKEEARATAFFNALGATMGESIHHHMRSYGDRLTPDSKAWQKKSALFLAA